MDKKNEKKTCNYCKNQVLCKAYWEMMTAMQSFARIDTTNGNAYMQIMTVMAGACKYYEQDPEVK
jgi:hypothetical protein